MSYVGLIELAWRLYSLGMATSEAIGWLSLISGSIGYIFTKTNVRRSQRYRGLILGGAGALVSVLASGSLYELITFIMVGETGAIDHTTAMYPDVFLSQFSGPLEDVATMSGTISMIAAIIGVTSVSFGSGLWGVTVPTSEIREKAKTIFKTGIALMAASVSERVFVGVAYVLSRSVQLGIN